MTKTNSSVIYTIVYRLILSAIAALFAISLWAMIPETNPGSVEAWVNHFKALPLWNWLWVLSLPTYYALVYLKEKRAFGRYFLKIFGIVLAIMAVPTFYAIREAFLPNTTQWVVIATALGVWISLGLVGAYWMAWNRYLRKPRQKQNQSWKRFTAHDQD